MESTTEPWREYIDEEIDYDKEAGDPMQMPLILRDMISSFPEDGQAAAEAAARRINADYWENYLPSDPLLKGRDDKGVEDFLGRLCHLSFHMGRLLRYDDTRQDAIVQLFLELRKLPQQRFQVYEVDSIIYHDDPVYLDMKEEFWNAFFANNDPAKAKDEVTKAYYEKRCDEWANYCALLARLTTAGLNDQLKYPDIDIPLAFKDDLAPGRLRDCRLMVAIQWILRAGKVIRKDVGNFNKSTWTIAAWKEWGRKLREIDEAGVANEGIARELKRALAEMVAVDPETFAEE